MKQIIQVSRNAGATEGKNGELVASFEVVLTTIEQGRAMTANREVVHAPILETFRFAATADGLHNLAEELERYACDAARLDGALKVVNVKIGDDAATLDAEGIE